MNPDEPSHTLIGIRTALVLYGALVIFALATLRGKALFFALLIVFAVAAKTLLHHLRSS